MRSRYAHFGIILAQFIVAVCGCAASPLRLVQSISLPGVEGRIDHFTIDVKRQRLFVAALGNNSVEVIDLASGKRIKSLHGFHEPQGVVFVPEFNRLFVASGGDATCEVLDGVTFKVLNSVKLSNDADNLRYDAAEKRVYVGYGDGGIGLLSAKDGKRLGDIRLPGHPEAFEIEKPGPRVFINVPTANQICIADRKRLTMIKSWSLAGARSNFPMAYNGATRELFVGCRNPAKVLVVDSTSGGRIETLDIAGDVDDIFYDSAHKRLYCSCGAGYINVFQQMANHFKALARIRTASGSRTSLFVPELSRLYLAVPHHGRQPAEVRVYVVGR